MAMTPEAQQEFLANLGLDKPAKVTHKATTTTVEVPVNARTMPVSEIVFDPALLAEFVLDSTDMKAASDKVFALYKSEGRNKERNGLLHRRITEFINQVKRDRGGKPVGYVKEKVKATKDQRDIAQVLAEQGITPDMLAAYLASQMKAEEA